MTGQAMPSQSTSHTIVTVKEKVISVSRYRENVVVALHTRHRNRNRHRHRITNVI